MHQEVFIPAKLLRRYNRFLADVIIEGEDKQAKAYCPNPGNMNGVAEFGTKIWLRRSNNSKTRLKYDWVISEVNGGYVAVDTNLANRLIGLALEANLIKELSGYTVFKRESVYLQSRFDFFLAGHTENPNCFLEVKSAALADGDDSLFPNSKTERGRKHLEHLILARNDNLRAVQLFCICRADTKQLRPADHVDELYGSVLRRAYQNGVEILAYTIDISRAGNKFTFSIGKSIDVKLY